MRHHLVTLLLNHQLVCLVSLCNQAKHRRGYQDSPTNQQVECSLVWELKSVVKLQVQACSKLENEFYSSPLELLKLNY